VLVPSERHVEDEAARGARALTVRDFTQSLAELAAPELRATSPEASRLLLTRLLPGRSAALAQSVDDALGQLRRAGVSSAALLQCGGMRAVLLSETLTKVNARLATLGLRDERETGYFAARALALPGLACPELTGIGQVRLRGLTRWENADFAWLEALHRRLRASGGRGVLIELPGTSAEALGPVLHDAVSTLATRLEQRWATENDPPSLEFTDLRVGRTPPSVVRAAHEASEARAVARAVLDAVSSGAALDRIAVVAVDPAEAFLEPLRAEFAAARLPFSEPWGKPASAAPEAHAALQLMQMAQGPVPRDALVDVLRVPDLDLSTLAPGVTRRAPLADAIERLPVKVDRTGSEFTSMLDARLRRVEREHEREPLLLARNVVGALFARFAELSRDNTRQGFRQAWLRLFAELGLLSASRYGLTQAIVQAEHGNSASLSALGHNATAGRAIDAAFERVASGAELLGLRDEVLGLSDFFEEFSTALASVGVGQGARRAGALRIASAAELAGLDWDLVVVCRAASSSLDWQSASSDGVLDAELVEQLPASARPLTAADRALFTRAALASALSRAKRSVVTWAGRDASGTSGASRFVASLPKGERPQAIEPASPLDPLASRVTPLPALTAEVRARAAIDVERWNFYNAPERALDDHNGLAGDLSALVGGDQERPIALTQLERYARCAFLGFSGAVLRAVRDDTVGDGLSARERGTLIHDALAVALQGTRERWGSADPAELEGEARKRAEEFLRAQIGSNLRSAALRAALDDVNALIRWSFANDDGIWFSEAERAFGVGSPWSALPVGEHFVSGRIDRIDSNSDRSAVRIIDYKTGDVRLTGAHGEQLLQPWIYARKVAEEYGAERVSSGYLTLQRRKPEWKPALPESSPTNEAISNKLTQTAALIHDLRRGLVAARPAVPGSCTRCDARDICRRPLSAPHESEE